MEWAVGVDLRRQAGASNLGNLGIFYECGIVGHVYVRAGIC